MKYLTFIIFLILSSCAGISSDFGAANLTDDEYSEIHDGESFLDIHERLGSSYSTKQSDKQMTVTYTNDSSSNGPNCEDILLHFSSDNKDKIYYLTKKEFKRTSASASRCGGGGLIAGGMNPQDAAMIGAAFASGAQSFINGPNTYAEEAKRKYETFCYMDDYGKKQSCYSTLEMCKQNIQMDRGGFCTWNQQ
jgi:hypothetical protein